MKILYYASILAGELDSPEHSYDEDTEAGGPDKSVPKVPANVQVWLFVELNQSILSNQIILLTL